MFTYVFGTWYQDHFKHGRHIMGSQPVRSGLSSASSAARSGSVSGLARPDSGSRATTTAEALAEMRPSSLRISSDVRTLDRPIDVEPARTITAPSRA